MPGALSDILVGNEQGVFLRHLKVDAPGAPSESRAPHLLPTAGFLDDSWFNRTGWAIGPVRGQILAFDQTAVYGVAAYGSSNRSGFFFPGKGYSLFAAVPGRTVADRRTKRKGPAERWRVRVPIRVRGMVVARDHLVIAGSPDSVPDDDPWAAFEGRKGGVLWIVSAADGRRLAEHKLDSPPVFDGLAVAGHRLYMSTTDGKVVCLGRRQ
jgi:hypothetical protein